MRPNALRRRTRSLGRRVAPHAERIALRLRRLRPHALHLARSIRRESLDPLARRALVQHSLARILTRPVELAQLSIPPFHLRACVRLRVFSTREFSAGTRGASHRRVSEP